MKTGCRAGWWSILFLLAVCHAPAQVLPSVDIDTARTQIDQFLRENELIEARISELLATNEDLTADIELWKGWLAGVSTVTARTVEKAEQLTDILSELASKSLTERTQNVLERYYRIKSILEDKNKELTERIDAAEASIRRNGEVIAELRNKTQSNLDNVELLKAAIERSAGSEEMINSYIEDLEKALDEAQKLINQSF
ncbi:MAG: hypothetical protein JW852_01535 [Spirochaetales bacterium]|nr:hypothetical protein [Spirochaetales bacterium]